MVVVTGEAKGGMEGWRSVMVMILGRLRFWGEGDGHESLLGTASEKWSHNGDMCLSIHSFIHLLSQAISAPMAISARLSACLLIDQPSRQGKQAIHVL